MQLDIHTLSAISTALLIGIATVLGTLALSNSRYRTVVGSFAAGYGMLACGFVGLSLRNYIPELFSIVLANCLLGGAIVLFWRGARYMAGKLPRRGIEAGLIGSLTLIFLYFTYVQPNTQVRIVALTTFVMLAMWLGGVELWAKAKAGWGAERLIVGVCIFGTMLFGLRLPLILTRTSPADMGHMTPAQAAVFLLLPIMNDIVLAFGVTWFALSKVNEELAAQRVALLEAKDEAERANQVKSRFLANMSHELRTPLNAIIGFSQIIKDDLMGPGKPIYANYARDIFHAGEHLLEIINNILDISKIEAGKTELRDDLIDPAKIVDDSIAAMHVQAEGKHIELTADIPADTPLIRGDTVRIRQILINLVSNAVKFTEAGHVKVSVVFDTVSGFRFVVADTGIGMAADEIEKALESFGQVDNAVSKKYAGTGLGLPLAKSLVLLHDGRLEISSAPGAGTTVFVRLPPERIVRKAHEAAA
ncbi:MAG: ATP-binding protein [Stellaceae bacterium]